MCCRTIRLTIYGRVQGVGFRPSVCRLAKQYRLQGWVRNLGNGVEIISRGMKENLQAFKAALGRFERPAFIEQIHEEELSPKESAALAIGEEFAVVGSGENVCGNTFFPADLALCPECAKDLLTPGNHRYRYPYISCASCGPRYTIMRGLPYDRQNTTMDKYSLCSVCAGEYQDMGNRRGRAETIACHDCGPQLQGWDKGDEQPLWSEDAVARARELLQQGKIILVKSLGGFNLVCRANEKMAVADLRRLKQRPSKPLAVMVGDVEAARKLCWVSEKEEELLLGGVRPILLLSKRETASCLALNVSFGTPYLGIFLPPMGLYSLLLEDGVPLIVTSANYIGQPILTDEKKAEQFYRRHKEIAGCFTYDREILRPADDSVMQVTSGVPMVLRRTRGFLPEPITIPYPSPLNPQFSILAVGAQMEPGFCLAKDNKFYPAQVPGHGEEAATAEEWWCRERDWEEFLHITPGLVVGDLHPNYDSTRWGRKIAEERNLPFLQVQHHFAHALSVVAEHNLQGPVLAVTFDGTGYGEDGSIWGGEFLLCDGREYERVAHLDSVMLIGGDDSLRQAWKTALCYLYGAGLPLPEDDRSQLLQRALQNKINTVSNSSMGRLFDAVASILGLGEVNTHQGCCAQRVEEAAVYALKRKISPLPLHFAKEGNTYSAQGLIKNIAQVDKNDYDRVAAAALGFHYAVAEMVVGEALELRQQRGVGQIVLTGGCFVNRVLLEKGCKDLQKENFSIYFNRQVSPGDGGIPLGQAYYGRLWQVH